MRTEKILVCVLAGVAVGALLGILFAPDKGSETRKKISEKGKEFTSDLSEKLNVFLDNMGDKFESATKKSGESQDNVTENIKPEVNS